MMSRGRQQEVARLLGSLPCAALTGVLSDAAGYQVTPAKVTVAPEWRNCGVTWRGLRAYIEPVQDVGTGWGWAAELDNTDIPNLLRVQDSRGDVFPTFQAAFMALVGFVATRRARAALTRGERASWAMPIPTNDIACEAGMFTQCGEVNSRKCVCCGLWLCSTHYCQPDTPNTPNQPTNTREK